MKPRFGFIDSELEQIKKNHLYRKLRYGTTNGGIITIQGKKLVNLCSNDYLGIPVISMKIKQMQSSSRLVSGNDESYLKLDMIHHFQIQDENLTASVLSSIWW